MSFLRKVLQLRPRHVWWNLRFAFDQSRGKRVIHLIARTGHSLDYLLPIYRAAEKQNQLRAYFILANKGEDRQLDTDMQQSLQELGISRSAMIGKIVLFGDFAVSAHPSGKMMPVNRKIPRAYAPHSLVHKINQTGEAMQSFDFLFSTGPDCTEMAEESIRLGEARYDIWPVGYPKTDELFSRTQSQRDRPTVLFAPTWGKHAALDVYGLEPIDALIHAGYNVIIKLHSITMYPHPSNRLNWREELKQYESNPQVKLGGTGNINHWFPHADVMISDASGAAYEFLLMGKPVVFLDIPKYFEDESDPAYNKRRHDLSYWGRTAGLIVNNMKDLVAAVDLCVQGRDGKADARAKLRERLLYNPGKAAEVALECIEKFLNR